ncbi:metalloregulator ArsR/SmtB family transcription factor [Thalassotalea psychrophila]|uniref:Metalloregulator ArsR/SmtB family transcription factor n=1 Tax=Thalassotalea psychrophila TaxID=3065647 RepID=A0ABY9TZT4_9GAMM|nr:metalloregulator ArsR/SmtB family transcription factor [Colwelliaceae bacterium SQ149]
MSPTEFFKNLADDTRTKSLMLIHLEEELCVCELMVALEDSQPKISRHLAQLKKSGVLVDRKQSQWVYYRINPNLAEWAKKIIADTSSANTEFIQNSLTNLMKMGDRPERMKNCCD